MYGVGFAALRYEKSAKGPMEKGTIEPGSSYLAILSMTGLLGAISFLLLMLPMLSPSNLRKASQVSVYPIACLMFFAIHFVGEGYIFAAGSVQNVIFWLVCGVLYPYKKHFSPKKKLY